jgi:hypothetical protein
VSLVELTDGRGGEQGVGRSQNHRRRERLVVFIIQYSLKFQVRRRITEEFSARQAESDSLKKIGERIFQKKRPKTMEN